jgi:type II secretory pathway component GspD/PulD (secretin)
VGWLFKKRDKQVSDVELMVFMQPKVTRTPADAKDLLDETYRKSPGIKEWDRQSHSQPPKPGKGNP